MQTYYRIMSIMLLARVCQPGRCMILSKSAPSLPDRISRRLCLLINSQSLWRMYRAFPSLGQSKTTRSSDIRAPRYLFWLNPPCTIYFGFKDRRKVSISLKAFSSSGVGVRRPKNLHLQDSYVPGGKISHGTSVMGMMSLPSLAGSPTSIAPVFSSSRLRQWRRSNLKDLSFRSGS